MTILELAHQIGIRPKWVAGTAGGEYHSSCPICGGFDRFYMQPNRQMSKCLGFYCCRKCGTSGDTIQFARQFLNYSFQEAAQTINTSTLEKPLLKAYNVFEPVILQSPSAKWIEKATEFVEQTHKNLLQEDEAIGYLENRGISTEAVINYKFGWSNKNEFLSRSEWGLDEQTTQEGKQRLLWIPKGIVIPTIEPSGKVMRLKIRRFDWQEGDTRPKYVAISGSMNGLTLIGSSQSKVMIVVESELDAYAIDFAARDFIATIAVGSNIKNPDNLTHSRARNIRHLLICHDNDEAGFKMLLKWQKLYLHAKPYPSPVGKDIGEAIKQGLNVREWLLQYKS